LRFFRSKAISTNLQVPWLNATQRLVGYSRWALPPSNDSFAIAPQRIFSHLPFRPDNAVTHLTAARGFKAKVAQLKKIGKWYIGNADIDALAERALARRSSGRRGAGARVGRGGAHHPEPRTSVGAEAEAGSKGVGR